jgi:hypothetical protein
MDYHITGDNLTVDTTKLGQADWTTYYLDGKGINITLTNANVVVGAGDATIIATDMWSAACFWNQPKVGININLKTGVGTGSQGAALRLVNVHNIQGSYLDDRLVGGASDTFFWGNGGNDYFQGGDGINTLGLGGLLSRYSVKVSIDGLNATVTDNEAGGVASRNVTTLVNVQRLQLWNAATSSSISYDLQSFITDQDRAIQGLLPPSPARWNSNSALGTPTSVSYSFAPGGLSVNAQAAVKSILTATSAVVGLDFVLVSAGAQITIGAGPQISGMGSVAGSPAATGGHCDLTFNSNLLSDTSPATAGFEALLRGIGAALGLKDANYAVGGSSATVLATRDDFTINTAMSVKAFDPQGGHRDGWGRLDLIALQSLYGVRTTQLGNDTYTLNDASGLTLHTVVDNGGTNTLDASNCTFGVTLNLNAGAMSSAGVTPQGTAAFNNIALSANTAIQVAIGSAHDDWLIGNDLDNTFVPGLGNDLIQGGKGSNTVLLAGPWRAYLAAIETRSGIATLTLQSADGISGTKTGTGILNYQFTDTMLQLGSDSATLSLRTAGSFLVGQGIGFGRVVGTGGSDTAVFDGNLADYTIAYKPAQQLATVADANASRNGSNTFLSFERLQFADLSINLVARAQASTIASNNLTRIEELYIAFFNRVPDADGLSYWIQQFKGGQSINQIAAQFYDIGIQYSNLTGFSQSMSNTDFINLVYKNVLGRKDGADAAGLDYWNKELANGIARGQLVSTILDAAHTFKNDTTYGWVANLLDNKIMVAQTFAINLGLNYNTPSESITQGMKIAAAVTPIDFQAAIQLIGVHTDLLLLNQL